jgi:hypothetical protein
MMLRGTMIIRKVVDTRITDSIQKGCFMFCVEPTAKNSVRNHSPRSYQMC